MKKIKERKNSNASTILDLITTPYVMLLTRQKRILNKPTNLDQKE